MSLAVDHHLPADPALRQLLEGARQQLQALASSLRSSLPEGIELASLLDGQPPAADQVMELKSAIDGLLQQGDWAHALPLATWLFSQARNDPAAAYRLGTCLQRMGKPAEAGAVFAHCTLCERDRPSPGPLLRLGECMAALGQTEQALAVFDACIEVARGDPAHAALQDIATRKAETLRSLQRSGPAPMAGPPFTSGFP